VGSSPHAGTGRRELGDLRVGDRLIPARGDRTSSPAMASHWSAAHPRTRGPDPDEGITLDDFDGSSPHAGTGLCGRR